MSKLSPDQWTNYWNTSSNINSFGKVNYSNDIAAFWREQLQDQHYQSIIDLACGNGAISWLANEILNSEANTTTITGVDSANIKPFELLDRQSCDYPMLNFLGNTMVESLPFDNHSFDAAISQYGIEYSDLNKSISEVSRVLKPTSRVHFIVHSTDSEIFKQSTASLKQYESIVNELKPHQEFQELDKIIGSETDIIKLRGNPEFIHQGKIIENKMIILNHIIKNGKSPGALISFKQQLIEYFSEQAIAKGQNGRAESIERARKSLLAYIKRIKDLVGIALSTEDINQLCELLENHGFNITCNKTLKHEDIENAGNIIIAERNQ